MRSMKSPSSKFLVFKRGWFQPLILFTLFQFYFYFVELTGWGPRMREIKSGFLNNVVTSDLFTKYFSFYEIPWHNLVTVVFGFITILYVIIGVIMDYKQLKEFN